MFCRKTAEGPLFLVFPVLPPILYIVYSFSLACNVAWLLIWDKEYMEVALVFINLMTCTLYICLVVSIRRINEYGHLMLRHKLRKDIWAIRLIVQNGLAVYASWGTVASVFNFAIVLTYRTGLSGDRQDVGSTVSLILFTLEIFAWFIFDNFVFEKLLRYLLTPYPVVVVSLVGILSKNWDPSERNSIFTAALLGMSILMSIVKLVLVTWRHYKKPIFSNKPQNYRRPVVSFEVRNLLEQWCWILLAWHCQDAHLQDNRTGCSDADNSKGLSAVRIQQAHVLGILKRHPQSKLWLLSGNRLPKEAWITPTERFESSFCKLESCADDGMKKELDNLDVGHQLWTSRSLFGDEHLSQR